MKDHGGIPNQQTILRAIARAKFRSSIDLSNWYFQIRVDPEDEKYNTIKTPFGSFACKVMLQGDANAPATAMRVIESVLDGLIGKCVWAYMDDITIFSETYEDHIKDIREVCKRLQKHQICTSPKKCIFFAKELPLLGHKIDDRGIHPDPEKIRSIQDWPTPKNKKQLQTFLGVVNYHAQFLPHLATISAPLSDLTSQEEYEWRPIHAEAFTQIKQLAAETIPLRPVDYNSDQTVYLVTDASKVGAGAWVGQGTSPESAYPAAFHSRKFATSQLHYPVHELELLAVVDAIQAFHPILYGIKFTVVSDNKSLSYFLKQTNLNYRMTRLRMFLQSYEFDIIHRPGKDNHLADALSRICEEHPAEDDVILVDPTEKKSIKGPTSAMSSTTRHYLKLLDTHLTLPSNFSSFCFASDQVPSVKILSIPEYLSMSTTTQDGSNYTTEKVKQEDSNNNSVTQQRMEQATQALLQATQVLEECEDIPGEDDDPTESPLTARSLIQAAHEQLKRLAARLESPNIPLEHPLRPEPINELFYQLQESITMLQDLVHQNSGKYRRNNQQSTTPGPSRDVNRLDAFLKSNRHRDTNWHGCFWNECTTHLEEKQQADHYPLGPRDIPRPPPLYSSALVTTLYPDAPSRPGNLWALATDLTDEDGISIYQPLRVRNHVPDSQSYATGCVDTLPTPDAPLDYESPFFDPPSKSLDARAFQLNAHFKGRWYMAIMKETLDDPLYQVI